MKQQVVLVRISDRVQEALKLVQETGCTPYAAVQQTGCDKVSLYRALREGTVQAVDGTLCLDNDAYRTWQQAVAIYLKEEMTLTEFQRRFHFKAEQLRKNLPLFSSAGLNDNRIGYARGIFSTIDSEEKAYWYGFLLADGGLYKNELRLKLGQIDEDHLRKFCAFIGADPRQLIRVERHETTGRLLCKVTLSSVEMVISLKAHGMDYRKSGHERVPRFAIEDDALAVPFLRGVFDGDGCIRSNFQHLSLVGSKELLEFASSLASRLTSARSATIYDHQTYHKAFWYGHDKHLLADMLYRDASVYLQRKFDLAERFAVRRSNVPDHDWGKKREGASRLIRAEVAA